MLKSFLVFGAVMLALALGIPRVAPGLFAVKDAPRADVARTPAAKKGPVAEKAHIRADRSGHFTANVEIQGTSVRGVIDTGATFVALRYEDAERIGLLRSSRVRFDQRVSTANGVGKAAAVRLNEVRIGDLVVYDVEALVLDRGALAINLIGMNFLRRLSRVDVRPDVIVLER